MTPQPTTWRQRVHRWWINRLPATDALALTHRNVYILPTRGGCLFAVTLLILLVASINYQLSLGYVLTFLLAGSGAVSMHITHQTLRGLTLHLRASAPVFVGESARLDIALHSDASRARHGIGMQWDDSSSPQRPRQRQWTYVDLPPGGHANQQLHFLPERRGWHDVPPIRLETRFPLGLFRVWALWRPCARVLAYPNPESPAVTLPLSRGATGVHATTLRRDSNEITDVRAWRRGDAMHAIVWKQAAKAMASGGEWIVRDTNSHAHLTLWLDWQDTQGLPTEQRLSRLTRWVLEADGAGMAWGLRTPGLELPPQRGDAHRRQALERLALWA